APRLFDAPDRAANARHNLCIGVGPANGPAWRLTPDVVRQGSRRSRSGRVHFVAPSPTTRHDPLALTMRLLLPLALLLLLVSAGGATAQMTDVSGLQFVADNAPTAAAAQLSPTSL